MMKRFLLLMLVLLLASSALADTSPDVLNAFAEEVIPGYTVYDGVMLDQSAMLLLSNETGQFVFAGCLRDGDTWHVTLSAPLPKWVNAGLDTFHAEEDAIRLWLWFPPEHRAYDDVDSAYVVLCAQPDGTWKVRFINTGWEVMALYPDCVCLDVGIRYYGTLPGSLDITQVDWATLPFSREQAVAWLDMTDWRIMNADQVPVYAGCDTDSAVLCRGAAGSPWRVLDTAEDMVACVSLDGCVTGWVRRDDLLPAAEQMIRSGYETCSYLDNRFQPRDMLLRQDAPAVSMYRVAHDESTVLPIRTQDCVSLMLLGWCGEGCCYLLTEQASGQTGFVPISWLAELPE